MAKAAAAAETHSTAAPAAAAAAAAAEAVAVAAAAAAAARGAGGRVVNRTAHEVRRRPRALLVGESAMREHGISEGRPA
eukprot:scaffold134822_cov75-Phaeocystis_antarctica.AAC.1